ncbi:MAG TPA: ABC transporter ATP-binding protein/permease [Candidatus Ruthenibacterium avium]|uniref:ABC transporter ATP-binding protein/permease n=1 Tax=Candidatus Ruthenibacterium avium TaxID=2838751 RepID=A0A9D2S2D7_9FIRM|nr:ABC transporter ATP-binding protein/permease [Candidatus Ruthenibacterium avium]
MNKGTPWKTAKRLMGYVAGTLRLQFVAVCVAILVSAVASMAGPLFLQYLIDDLIVPLASQETPDFSSLLRAVILMGCLYYAGVIATYVYSRLMVNIGQGVLKRVRDEMFAHMQRLPIRYFDTHPHGEIMSLYTNDTDTLRQMISQSIPQTFYSLVSVVAIFGVMLSISIPLSILAVLMVLLMMKVTKDIGGKSGRGFIAQQTDLAKVNAYIEEMMAGQKVIKVFNHENAAKHDFDVLNEKLCQSATTANTYGNMLMPIIGNIGYLQYVLTALIGSVLSISGISAITLGALASFLQFTRNFIMPFSQISQQMNAIVMALAGAQRIFDMMDETQETDEGYVTLVNARYNHDGELVECAERTEIWAWKHPHSDGSVTYTRLCGDVRFEDMTFGYTPEKTVLHNVTLYAKPGQKLAFVGSTGAGKTTITNLINRFYDVEDGKIRYDGININKIRKDDLRRSLGIVLQDTHLFTGTIMENIRYGRLDATDEEVYAAARLANADGFIKRLPHGYETVISGEGEDLSQGQRQLLAIARAAVADPPVLILDEATSSIDTRTEAIVQDGMDRLMSGRTVFVIAHRLSTIRNSDAIMVLEHGRIIERGDHESLLAKKGTYYQLYTGALELD